MKRLSHEMTVIHVVLCIIHNLQREDGIPAAAFRKGFVRHPGGHPEGRSRRQSSPLSFLCISIDLITALAFLCMHKYASLNILNEQAHGVSRTGLVIPTNHRKSRVGYGSPDLSALL